MANEFYTHGTFPSPNTKITSAAMRSELDLITTGFDKLPALAGNGGKLVAINTGATGMTVTSTAPNADKLTTARTISATGDLAWSVSFDGTSNVASAATLANTGVVAGSYGSASAVPVITVDAKGRVTGITTQAIPGSLTFTGDVTGTGATGGSTALTLANSGVVAGTYTKVTVDAKGRVTSGAALASTDVTTALGYTPYNSSNPNSYTSNTGTVTSVGLSLPTIFSVTGSPVTTSGTLSASLASQTANTVLAAPNGAAGAPSFRALVAADIPTLNQNTTGTAANVTGTVAVANGGTGSTTAAGALDNLGAYAASNPNGYTSNTGTVTSVATGTGLSGGPITTTGTISLANTTVTPGSYTYASITVDAQGRLTAASSGAAPTSAYVGIRGQLFTASGTFTVPADVTAIKVTVVGGGGGGSGGNGSTTGRLGGGGGAAVEYLTGLTPGSTVSVTIGNYGAGGAYNTSGGAGGTSSFGAYCSATGGAGGPVGSGSASGGSGSGGTLNYTGVTSRAAGFSILGGVSGAESGGNATEYGNGGAGGPVSGAGYRGSAGAVFVEW